MRIVLRVVAGVLVVFGLLSMFWGVLGPVLALFLTGGTEVFSWRGGGKFVVTRAGVGVISVAVGAAVLALSFSRRRRTEGEDQRVS